MVMDSTFDHFVLDLLNDATFKTSNPLDDAMEVM